MRIFALLLFISLGIVLSSCEDEVDERPTDEKLRFDAFMRVNYPSLEPTESGLYYKLLSSSGSDMKADSGDYILYDYSIQNLDGRVVETTSRRTAFLHDILSNTTNYAPAFRMYKNPERPIIKGLTEGIQYLAEGDSARFFMLSSMAYGSSTHKVLQPYTSIIADFKLQRVVKNPQKYEQELIDNYVAKHYPDLTLDDILTDGIYFLELDEGHPDADYFVDEDVVSVNYVGTLTNGFTFDTNIQQEAAARGIYNAQKSYNPISVTIGTLSFIEGFSVVLSQMKPEGRAKVIIPSTLAYGTEGTQNIQPYAPLVFEIIVLDEYDEGDDD